MNVLTKEVAINQQSVCLDISVCVCDYCLSVYMYIIE